MRTLLVLRGPSGSGKSTFIRENGLEPFTVCPDSLRLLIDGLEMTESGNMAISQRSNKYIWGDMLPNILEKRMKKGAFTVIDATHTTAKSFKKYKKLMEAYKYRGYVIDFTKTGTLEDFSERNNLRQSWKKVPDSVVVEQYRKCVEFKPPCYFTAINSFNDVLYSPMDLTSKYRKIVHIGDIHSCYEPLLKYFTDTGGLLDDVFYIFVGDYFDRGPNTVEVYQFLNKLIARDNVLLLEGNHEYHIRDFLHGNDILSKDFVKTLKELESSGVTPSDLRRLYRKMAQMAYYTFNGLPVVVTHGGITKMPDNFLYANADQLIKGVGGYNLPVDEIFSSNVESFVRLTDAVPVYQIHGHRNTTSMPVHPAKYSYNLQGDVEFGDCLRIVELGPGPFTEISIKNNTFVPFPVSGPENRTIFPYNSTIEKMWRHPGIKATVCSDDSLVSFNYNRDTFTKGKWDNLTRRARGLFYSLHSGDVVIRSYSKFFNINEMIESSEGTLINTLKPPIYLYEKYNGFLGLLGYDKARDCPVFASKSTTDGPHAELFKDILTGQISKCYINKLVQWLAEYGFTAVFEVMDSEVDPHIVYYKYPRIVLLDFVNNNSSKKMPFNLAEDLAKEFNIPFKQVLYRAESSSDAIMHAKSLYHVDLIEGAVLKDIEGALVKIKTKWYSQLKVFRTKLDLYNKGAKEMQFTEVQKKFIDWWGKEDNNHLTFPQAVHAFEAIMPLV